MKKKKRKKQEGYQTSPKLLCQISMITPLSDFNSDGTHSIKDKK